VPKENKPSNRGCREGLINRTLGSAMKKKSVIGKWKIKYETESEKSNVVWK
jgi:hypothetical protein